MVNDKDNNSSASSISSDGWSTGKSSSSEVSNKENKNETKTRNLKNRKRTKPKGLNPSSMAVKSLKREQEMSPEEEVNQGEIDTKAGAKEFFKAFIATFEEDIIKKSNSKNGSIEVEAVTEVLNEQLKKAKKYSSSHPEAKTMKNAINNSVKLFSRNKKQNSNLKKAIGSAIEKYDLEKIENLDDFETNKSTDESLKKQQKTEIEYGSKEIRKDIGVNSELEDILRFNQDYIKSDSSVLTQQKKRTSFVEEEKARRAQSDEPSIKR